MILPWLLHHANRSHKSDALYAIKDSLTARGVVVGYDVQHIEGKKCFSCNGTGVHKKYDRYGFVYDADCCWHCINGWYKRPMWILLQRTKYGPYIFHKPIHRVYTKNNTLNIPIGFPVGSIEGYVDHRYSKYGHYCVMVLFLIYNRVEARKYFNELGIGWRVRWWLPQNWLHCAAHFYRHGRTAYPLREFKERFERKLALIKNEPAWRQRFREYYFEKKRSGDLPF